MRDQVTGNNKLNSFNVCSELHLIKDLVPYTNQ